MQLWLVGGGLLGAAVGYFSQKKAKKEIGAVVGAGVGALAGVALKWQYDAYAVGRQALAPYASEAAGRVGAAASAAGSALTTPSTQQLPAKTAGTSVYTPPKGSSDVGVSASEVESLLDEAGLPDGEDMMSLLRDNPFDSWTIE